MEGNTQTGTVGALPGRIDLILTGGRVLDPAAGLDGIMDVGIGGGRIVAIAPSVEAADARRVSVEGSVVTPGIIDTHAHVYQHVSGDFGLNPDMVGVRSGVATVVDQGGASALTIDGFRHFIVDPSKTRVLSFVSAYLAGGLLGHKYVDLYGPTGINVGAIVKAATDNPDLIKGIKAHAEPGGYSRWGVESLKLAKQASRELKLPVYVHLGTLWPEKPGVSVDAKAIIEEVVPLLDPGDILAHPFTRYPSGFVAPDGSIHPLVREALAMGVRIDVGRGAHFSFDNAKAVLDGGILPHTIGADQHGYNVKLVGEKRWYRGIFSDTDLAPDDAPVDDSPYSTPLGMLHAMTELMALGVGLPDLVRMATANSADMLGLSGEIGVLRPGAPADVSVFRVLEGDWMLEDSNGVKVRTDRFLKPEMVVRAGEIIRADSPIIPEFADAA
ncbi:amidohydrolase/deacetylase family metallohydrolase [Skermanella mucosa]|uniref:amidohydrolase/deacetylase family metallohydrolase n=1 Tax=Skermanella mucosa TaxID=1789672 RepID=UPI00192A93CA|nr:amidohydrolase/deacetylase family metallohydrolase [Skermanella mucosa]UEM19817.1 amidohydrolase/deacetylase family metallohydrolase [Skermanella mucosa]